LRAAEVGRDFEFIFDYLVRAYVGFGDEAGRAGARAAARVGEALKYLRSFGTRPQRGTEQGAIRPGVRTVTHKNFVFYFEVDEGVGEVKVLAVFFGGVDHRRQIVERLRA